MAIRKYYAKLYYKNARLWVRVDVCIYISAQLILWTTAYFTRLHGESFECHRAMLLDVLSETYGYGFDFVGRVCALKYDENVSRTFQCAMWCGCTTCVCHSARAILNALEVWSCRLNFVPLWTFCIISFTRIARQFSRINKWRRWEVSDKAFERRSVWSIFGTQIIRFAPTCSGRI